MTECLKLLHQQCRIADFPEVGSPTLPGRGGGRRQHTILPNFPKNCMKLKEFGRGERGWGAHPSHPLRSAIKMRFDSFESKSLNFRNTFFRCYLVNKRQNEAIFT